VDDLKSLSREELKEFLDAKTDLYNRPEFIEKDPIQVPHLFCKQEDIEIAAFLTATLAWGQRTTIISNAKKLLGLMSNQPYEFIIHAGEQDYARFGNFCHRTFNSTDTLFFLQALKNLYNFHGGLQNVFEQGFKRDHHAQHAMIYFRKLFLETEYPLRTAKHISDVSRGSSAKRLNMFLRWMVRRDNRGVDFGMWTNIDQAWLSVPLDVHTGRTARRLGLLSRKYDDWRAVEELTAILRSFDPLDPVKYDFALFGIGAFEKSG